MKDLSLFKDHLKKYLSDEEINILISSFSSSSKHAVILNRKKMDDDKFLSLFPHATPHPIIPHAYLYDKNEYELGKSIYHELGCFYIQEPSAMLVSHFLNVEDNDYILDMCAAPGGKTIGTSLKLDNHGVIISNDIAKERCRDLLDNVMRMGLNNVIITNNDFSSIYQYYENTFDKIILDAPCSGSGMFRKDERMIDDWSFNKVIKNSLIQYNLIDIAYYMLKPGGTLIYSTCSYSYEENEEVIKHLLTNNDAEIVNFPQNPLFYVSKEKIGIHLFPYLFPGEGHYICMIKKPGNKKDNSFKTNNNFKRYLPDEISNFSSFKFFNNIYALPYDIRYKGINIYHFGIEVGEEIKNGNIIYSYHLAHALKHYQNEIELNEEETAKYLNGEQLTKANPYNGNLLLKYQGIPLDFSKTNGQWIKNHYPKYYRKKVNF